MTDPRDHRPLPGLDVTLVSGSDPRDCHRVDRGLSGGSASSRIGEIDVPGAGEAEFAVELAEALAADALGGATGAAVVVLEAGADVVEIALVLEHVLEAHESVERGPVPVGIRDVVAVASVREIVASLFGMAPHRAGPPVPTDWDSPGRLARRLEYASLVVLADVVSTDPPPEFALVRAFLARLAPAARVVAGDQVPAARAGARGPVRGRAHRLGASMGWQQQLAEGAPAAGVRGPITTAVFRDPRPFHPGRLHRALAEGLAPERVGRIIRSRGFTRLATRAEQVGSWSSAGDVLDLDPTGLRSWDADSPQGQEIAFFGLGLDVDALESTLAASLLTGPELAAGPVGWARFADPFPDWSVPHHH